MNYGLDKWVSGLDPRALSLWQGAMAQLNQLQGDVWNGVRFFLTLNGLVIAAAIGLSRLESKDIVTGVLIAILAMLGLIVTNIAQKILAEQRRYYLNMLLRKTLIERELGLYSQKLAGIDMSFPWSVENLKCMLDDPAGWIEKEMRPKGRITGYLFLVYDGVATVHLLGLLATLLGLDFGYFEGTPS